MSGIAPEGTFFKENSDSLFLFLPKNISCRYSEAPHFDAVLLMGMFLSGNRIYY